MHVEDVKACNFSSWYNVFKDVTMKSIIIPLPVSFLDYLHTDGIILPESSTQGVCVKSSNIAMDGDDDDPDIRDDELMKMYEDDWSLADKEEPSSQAPDFGDFEQKVKQALTALGGPAFPKLNWSSPKDASWISFDRTLMCTCPSDVYLLLKSSRFVAHDLDHAFSSCVDYDATSAPPINYNLVLRSWMPPHPCSEFRCFVKERKVIGICQRNHDKYFRSIVKDKVKIVADIQDFFTSRVKEQFSRSSYVFDVICLKQGVVKLVDFNPWNPVTDGLLFSWDELNDSTKWENLQSPEFRCVESEEGVQSSNYASYALPQDVVDLAAGEDPYKMMDLLKLQSRKPGDSSSSDEDDNRKS